MTLQELGTIMQFDVDVKILILNNRFLGCLWHCLQTSRHYDEATAFPTRQATPEAA